MIGVFHFSIRGSLFGIHHDQRTTIFCPPPHLNGLQIAPSFMIQGQKIKRENPSKLSCGDPLAVVSCYLSIFIDVVPMYRF